MNPFSDELRSRLLQEADQGFPSFRGTDIRGEIIARQDVVNRDLLSQVAGGRVRVLFRERQQLQFVVAGFKTLDATIEGIDSELTLTLKVSIWGRGLLTMILAVVNVPYVQLKGNQVVVRIGSVPKVAKWRPVWRNQEPARITTSTGQVAIGYHFQVS